MMNNTIRENYKILSYTFYVMNTLYLCSLIFIIILITRKDINYVMVIFCLLSILSSILGYISISKKIFYLNIPNIIFCAIHQILLDYLLFLTIQDNLNSVFRYIFVAIIIYYKLFSTLSIVLCTKMDEIKHIEHSMMNELELYNCNTNTNISINSQIYHPVNNQQI